MSHPGRPTARWLLALVLACFAQGCSSDEPASVRIFAASSLTEVLEALGAEAPASCELHLDGTQRLLIQLIQGARAEVFLTAHLAHMMMAEEAGLISEAPRLFARNRLALAVGAGNPHGIQSLKDLEDPSLRVALCSEEVPAGRYARDFLEAQSIRVRSCSDEPSVRSALAKLQMGEVDAVMVYATDLIVAGDAVESVPLPAEGTPAGYYVAALKGARNPALASEMVDFLTSAAARRVLAKHGFEAP